MNDHDSPEDVKTWQCAAYGFGDLGFNLYWTTVSLFLLYFYTDVLGFSGTLAGALFLIGMLWDAVSDPVVGVMAQRTRTRWGSYRPYILLAAVPLAGSMCLLFLDPGFTGVGMIAFALAAHIFFRTAYTFANIPYSALSARITRSSSVRNKLAAWRISLATIGSAIVGYSTLKLVAFFGRGDEAVGFTLTAITFAGLSLPVLFAMVLAVREVSVEEAREPRFDLREACARIASNRPFLIVMTASIFAILAGVMISKSIVYYFKYTLGDEEAVGIVFAVNSAMILLAAPLWAIVTAKTSKRFVWRVGALISIAGSLSLYFNNNETVAVVVAIAALSAIGSAAGYLCFWSALPDTVEYGELRNGYREEGLIFGIMSFVQKAAYGVAAAIAGVLLDAIGYQANETQSTQTLDALKMMMTLLPAALAAIAFMIIGQYRLDQRTHQRVRKIVHQRSERRGSIR